MGAGGRAAAGAGAAVPRTHLVFLQHVGWDACWMDFEPYRVAAGAAAAAPGTLERPRKAYRMNSDLNLAGRLAPLRTLVELYGDQQVAVFELAMDGLADTRGVVLWPERWKRITAAAKQQKKAPEKDETETEDSLESEGVEGWSSSTAPTLGTDAETEECDSSEAGEAEPGPVFGTGGHAAPGGGGHAAPAAADGDLEAFAADVAKLRARNLENCV